MYLECSPSDDHKLTFEKSQMYKLIDKHMNSIVLIISYPAMVQAAVNSKGMWKIIDFNLESYRCNLTLCACVCVRVCVCARVCVCVCTTKHCYFYINVIYVYCYNYLCSLSL